MFGNQSRQPRPIQQPDIEVQTIPDVTVAPETSSKNAQQTIFEKDMDLNNSELVKKVESISAIVSPYFIVVVGLYLMEKNFFLGLFLLVVGMFSLLKVSVQDIIIWFEKIKQSL